MIKRIPLRSVFLIYNKFNQEKLLMKIQLLILVSKKYTYPIKTDEIGLILSEIYDYQ